MSLIPNEAPPAEGEGTPPEGTPPAEAPPQEGNPPEPTYLFADGVAGEGDAPEWFKKDKYKTISAQAEAYPELEKKMGSFTGAPEDGKYEIEGVNFDDNPLLKTVAEWGGEKGLSNDGLSDLFNKVSELAASQQTEDETAAKEALGERADQRIQDLAQWGKNNLNTEEFVQFQGLAQNAGHVEVLEKLIGMTKNSKMVDKTIVEDANTKADKEAELKTMQLATNDKGQRLMDVNPAYRAKVTKAMKEYYGD